MFPGSLLGTHRIRHESFLQASKSRLGAGFGERGLLGERSVAMWWPTYRPLFDELVGRIPENAGNQHGEEQEHGIASST